MSTKALFSTAMGGLLSTFGPAKVFTRSSGNILTSVAHGLETGAGPFKILSTGNAPAGSVKSVRASTFMTGATIIVTDVLIVNGKSYTIIAAPLADGDVDLGANDSLTLANLAAAINLDPGAGSRYDIDMSPNAGVIARVTDIDIITIEALSLDAAAANAITVSSADGTMTVDNATLEGGVEGTSYFIIRLSANTFSIATSKALALAGTAQALSDAGTGVHTLQPLVDTLAEALEDVLVNHLTAKGTKVLSQAHNIFKFWQSAIDGSSVGDQP